MCDNVVRSLFALTPLTVDPEIPLFVCESVPIEVFCVSLSQISPT